MKRWIVGWGLGLLLVLSACGHEEKQTSVASPLEQQSSAEVARAEKAEKLDEIEDVAAETLEEIKRINENSQLPYMLLDRVDLPDGEYGPDNMYPGDQPMEGISLGYLPVDGEVQSGQLVRIDVVSGSYSVYGLYVGFDYAESLRTLEELGYQKVAEEDGLDFFEKDGVVFALEAGDTVESISLRLDEAAGGQ